GRDGAGLGLPAGHGEVATRAGDGTAATGDGGGGPMSDRDRITDERLGAALRALEVDWPATPELTSSVTATIRDVGRAPGAMRPRLSFPSRRRTVLILVGALLVLTAAAAATKLVIDLGAVTIRTTTGTPPASLPVFSPDAFGAPVADTAAASSRAGF